MTETETFAAGPAMEYAVAGVDALDSSTRHAHSRAIETPLNEKYGTDISSETASVVKRFNKTTDSTELVRAAKTLGFNEVDDWSERLAGFDLNLDEDESPDLSNAIQVIDKKLSYSHASREKTAADVSSKQERDKFYIPELVNEVGEEGDVYMAKTLSSPTKVKIAWDLHDENEVVVVDEYKWGNLLGWKKLKSLPHGKNNIREELGDQLSSEVLADIAAQTDTSDDSDSDSSSSGRRTRTKPTDEVLNVAISSKHNKRKKHKAEDIKEAFADDGYISVVHNRVTRLILFPTTTDLNMTDHWWVPGKLKWDDGYAAIANCNKGTFEYLNQCDEVMHIEDYIDQADDYEFDTNIGPITLNAVHRPNLVLHVVSESTKERLFASRAIDNMPDILPEYCENNMYTSVHLPHSDEMVYAPITLEECYHLRPELRGLTDDDVTVLHASENPRDIATSKNLSSDYKLYARARLPEWDFDSEELSTLDGASYSIDLDDGGFELVETLAKLHDAGKQPFSETPQARWSQ